MHVDGVAGEEDTVAGVGRVFGDSLTDFVSAPPFADFEVEGVAFEESLSSAADRVEIDRVAVVVPISSGFERDVQPGHISLAREDQHGAVFALDEAWVADVGKIGNGDDVDYTPVEVKSAGKPRTS